MCATAWRRSVRTWNINISFFHIFVAMKFIHSLVRCKTIRTVFSEIYTQLNMLSAVAGEKEYAINFIISHSFWLCVILGLEAHKGVRQTLTERNEINENFHTEYISCWLNYIDWMCQQWDNGNLPPLFPHVWVKDGNKSEVKIKFSIWEEHELINIHELKFSPSSNPTHSI